jgi:hypothetical protein
MDSEEFARPRPPSRKYNRTECAYKTPDILTSKANTQDRLDPRGINPPVYPRVTGEQVGECANTHSAVTRHSWSPQTTDRAYRNRHAKRALALENTAGTRRRLLTPFSEVHKTGAFPMRNRGVFTLHTSGKPTATSKVSPGVAGQYSTLTSPSPLYRPLRRALSRGRSLLIRDPPISRPRTEGNCHQTGNLWFLILLSAARHRGRLGPVKLAPPVCWQLSPIEGICAPAAGHGHFKPSGPFGPAYVLYSSAPWHPGAFTLLPPKRRERKEGGG